MAEDRRELEFPAEVDAYVGPLQELVRRVNPRRGLEIGVGFDAYSAQIFLYHSDGDLISIDKRDWKQKAAEVVGQYPDRYLFIEERSELMLPKLTGRFDWVFIDGDHAYVGAKRDMELCIPLLADDGIIILDDCDVDFPSAIDIINEGEVVNGMFGVGQAADEVFKKGWKLVHTDIKLANGGRVYARR